MKKCSVLGGRVSRAVELGAIAILIVTAAATGGASADTPTKVAPPLVPVAPTTADQVEAVASSPQFANTYGGDTVAADGSVTVYATTAGMAELTAALTRAVGPPAPSTYSVVAVAHTYAQLEALTQRIAGDRSSLAAQGVELQSWGPNVAANRVELRVRNGTPAASQSLASRYGSDWVATVPSTGGVPTRTTNRYYDYSPFWDGDRIFFDNNPGGGLCTDSFAYIGKRSGVTYQLTAGHCGGASIWTNLTNRYEVGPVSTNYFTATNGYWDLESASCGCVPPVWYANESAHTVLGSCACGPGQLVTMDGATSGEVPDNYVESTGNCVTFPEDGKTTCNLTYAYNSNGTSICQGGDSGGPIYQRTSGNGVYAVGVIVGTDYNWDCWYHPIGAVLTEVNGNLYTGG